MTHIRCSFIYALFLAVYSFASAQGSHFVLLGKGEDVPPEKKTVRPLTAPFLHEDALITTDVRAWFLYQDVGDGAEINGVQGEFDITTVQVRLAVTENLQAIMYKNGYTNIDSGDLDGWNDIGLGVKLALLQDVGSLLFVAVGFGYEVGSGDDQVLQDTDEYRFWASVNKGFGRLHFGATGNYIIAGDGKIDGLTGSSDLITLHFHADYFVTPWFSPVVEVNGYFVQEANSTISGVVLSGIDTFSVNGGEENDTITYALGFEVRPLDESLGLRAAYESQLNNEEDSLFGYRWTLSAVYEF